MDKETAVEFERIKAQQRIDAKDIKELKDIKESWDSLIRTSIIKTVTWLVTVGIAGAMFGWNLPENVRKAVAEWMAR